MVSHTFSFEVLSREDTDYYLIMWLDGIGNGVSRKQCGLNHSAIHTNVAVYRIFVFV